MTTEEIENVPVEKVQLNFTARVLPWIIAAGIFVVYVFTLNHWVTLRSLPVVAKVAGWDWRPAVTAPLHYLLTYPIHWLSGNAQLLALNLFSALCAALTLGLLARSVALMPQDRTRDQRQREIGKFALLDMPQAWLAPVVAVMVCGFQLSFWENATTGTGEMLDLLLFAYCIRCLLEFRISNRERWLTKLALIYGLAVTNNWAMIGFFPFFLIALIWIKGRSFFDFRFISRMAAFGAIGLMLYLLLPLITATSGNSEQTFLQSLKENLHIQKTYLFDLPFKQATVLRSHLFMIGLTSLLPLLMIGIRWPSFRGEVSPAGTAATTFMFRLMHLFFLGICIWIFFDPQFSARVLGFEIVPFLTFYYVTALCVGYFVGYGLLVFGRKPVHAWSRSTGIFKLVDPLVLVVMCIAVLAAPFALIRKNLPAIRATNSNALNQFSKWMAESLPPKGAVVLSDDPTRLFLVRAVEAQAGKTPENILLDTTSLPFPQYHKFLNAHNANWPAPKSVKEISQPELLENLTTLAKSHSIYYLHPSFGYYFEAFYPTPHKLVYQLQLYPTNTLIAPPLSPSVISENQNFWTAFAKDSLPQLQSFAKQSPEVRLLNTFYSRALDDWGTELQKAKMLSEAGSAFAEALALNPENVVAKINQQFNASLRKGELRAVEPNDELEKKLGQYRSLDGALSFNGPFDEPNFCVQLGEVFARGNNLRQSAQLFLRVLELSPQNFGARLGLAKTYIELRKPDESLKLVNQLRNDPKTSLVGTNAEIELLRVEALAHVAKNDLPTAEKILDIARRQHPKEEYPLALLTQLYLDLGKYTNALESVEKQLQITADNPRALFVKAVLNMQMGQYPPAIKTLDQLLKIQPENYNALLNRAIANLQSGKLDDAKRDYETLRDALPNETYQVYYGLADIAQKQNRRSDAIKNYKLYLKCGPKGTKEFAEVQKSLSALESGKN